MKARKTDDMLKINVTATPTEERWILQGRLTVPWVRELRTNWRKKHRLGAKRACVVDLSQITLIDRSGERFLRGLKKEGVQFIADGVYTKHLLEHLNAKEKRFILDLSEDHIERFELGGKDGS